MCTKDPTCNNCLKCQTYCDTADSIKYLPGYLHTGSLKHTIFLCKYL